MTPIAQTPSPLHLAPATPPQPAAIPLSVVIPAFDAERTLGAGLQALIAQARQFEPPVEVIVVDDGSHDGTAELARSLGAQVIVQANQGPAAARNHGVAAASGEIVLFTDSDCEPAPGWLAAMIRPFNDPDVVGVKGAYLTRQRELTPRFVQVEYEDRYDRMRQRASIDFIDTYSAAYRRALFLENGGFDTIFATASVEDQEFSFRLAQKGYRLVFASAAQVYHQHDHNLREYIRRKFFIGYYKALLTRWLPERLFKDSHTPQVLKVQMGLASLTAALLPAALFWTPARWGAGATALAFLLTALPFTWKALRKDLPVGLLAPFMLAVRALTLTAGFAAGQIHFRGDASGARRPLLNARQRAAKRLLDLIGASLGLAVSLIPMLFIAVAIKLDSPGPIFFTQTRVGANGRPFRLVKFRSMVHNAEARRHEVVDLDALQEPAYKVRNDPRVTRVGRWLRRFSLDELPQFVNVLRGEMSLVGPRPEEAALVARYNDWQRRRLAVKPGMTGPMQINGRGDLTLAQRVALEVDYIEHYSLARDLTILLRTLPAVLRGEGSY